jgi:FdhD protein
MIMELTEKLDILRVTADDNNTIEDLVTKEIPFTIVYNGNELVTMLCSPTELKSLAVGFLASEGLLKSRDEITRLVVNKRIGMSWIETKDNMKHNGELVFKRFISSGCGRGTSFYQFSDLNDKKPVLSNYSISPLRVFALLKEFQYRSQTFRATGGVHSAALYGDDKMLAFAEDIGRHNAIDKVFGHCLLEGIDTSNCIIVSSGRISSEILLKIARRGVPIVVSRSAPTNLGVKVAEDMGITLIGFVRGRRMNIYAHGNRVKADGD